MWNVNKFRDVDVALAGKDRDYLGGVVGLQGLVARAIRLCHVRYSWCGLRLRQQLATLVQCQNDHEHQLTLV